MAKGPDPRRKSQFQACHAGVYAVFVPLMALTVILWYNPNLVPEIGPLATLRRLGNDYHLVFALLSAFILVAHAGEAYYASNLCRQKRIKGSAKTKWIAQTFILGFPSLQLLRNQRRAD